MSSAAKKSFLSDTDIHVALVASRAAQGRRARSGNRAALLGFQNETALAIQVRRSNTGEALGVGQLDLFLKAVGVVKTFWVHSRQFQRFAKSLPERLGIGLLASGGAFPSRNEVLDAEGHGESLTGQHPQQPPGSPDWVNIGFHPAGLAILNSMISKEIIDAAVRLLAEGSEVQRVILFGSYATGLAREDSDLDFLVIESNLKARRKEMVRLRACLRPLRIPVDVMVADAGQFEVWKDHPGSALFEASRHGQVLYERAG